MEKRTLFTEVAPELYRTVEAVCAQTGLTKRAVIEATLADRAGTDHRDLVAVRRAWSVIRKENRA